MASLLRAAAKQGIAPNYVRRLLAAVNKTEDSTHVAQGQVISEVGYGIVGISTGPHLELGFADSSGAPIGPSSAPAMMSLLQGSY